MKLYLAHPVGSREVVRAWELDFEARSGIELINPFYDVPKPYPPDTPREKLYEYRPVVSVVPDIAAIEDSNGLIAVINEELSYGTIQEMVYAHIMRKLVYSLITNGEEKHPWLRYHSTEIFTNYKDLERFLLEMEK